MNAKTTLSLIGGVLILACTGNASPIACGSFLSWATLVSYGATGCEVGDMIFYNFSSSDAPSTLDGNITATNGASPYPTGYAVNFSSSAGDLTSSFSLSYSVGIDSSIAPPFDDITNIGAGQQVTDTSVASMTESVPGFGGGTVTVSSSGGTTIVSPSSGISGSATSVNLTDSYTYGSGNGALNFSDIFTDTVGSATPEPSAMLLMGGGLIGLGAVGRKRSRKP